MLNRAERQNHQPQVCQHFEVHIQSPELSHRWQSPLKMLRGFYEKCLDIYINLPQCMADDKLCKDNGRKKGFSVPGLPHKIIPSVHREILKLNHMLYFLHLLLI
jgi:hypothetical protein